jgi:hypothetical protein
MCLLLRLEGLRTLTVLRRVWSATVNASLPAIKLGALLFTPGVRRSYVVAVPGLVLTETSDMAELVALKVSSDSQVCRKWFVVKDLGLLDQSSIA